MVSLRLHVDEPVGEFDPIPFPTSLADRARRFESPRARSIDSIRMAEEALERADAGLNRLKSLVGDDDDRPRAA